jgi:hypothetical protein
MNHSIDADEDCSSGDSYPTETTKRRDMLSRIRFFPEQRTVIPLERHHIVR